MQHDDCVKNLQDQLKENRSLVSLSYSGQSNTTRTKSYKKKSHKLNFANLNRVLKIDSEKQVAIVEPRVTMDQLVKATLPYGLIPQIVPEFKGITVGGAIMGGAAESSSFKWGTFNDTCSAFEILLGDGTLLRLSKHENADLYYGIGSSYGSLGALVLAEIKLIRAKKFVHLSYHNFQDTDEALQFIQKISHEEIYDFIDGIVFSKNRVVVIVGTMKSDAKQISRTTKWYYQHVKNLSTYAETMPIYDYLFRYDQGAFWVGSYLFHFPLLRRFLTQGLFKISSSVPEIFTPEEIEIFHQPPDPNFFFRNLFHPFLTSKKLWGLLHKAETWIQNRTIIQDFCIPENDAAPFLKNVCEDPGIFPLWLCPIKGTKTPQIFSPHIIPENGSFTHFINVGIYGIPSYFAPIEQITKKIEAHCKKLNGRKVLYSCSYYTKEEFWEIYSQEAYQKLREKSCASEVWIDITEKVLSK